LLYFEAALILEAQEMLKSMNVTDYPMMKKEARQKLHRQVYKQAFPDQNKRVVTVQDLKKVLGSVE
jgi:hypothetical protein